LIGIVASEGWGNQGDETRAPEYPKSRRNPEESWRNPEIVRAFEVEIDPDFRAG
jgi:hypothetical protein